MSKANPKRLRTSSPDSPLIEQPLIDVEKSITFSVFRDGNTKEDSDNTFALDLTELSKDLPFINKLTKIKHGRNFKFPTSIEDRILREFTTVANFNNFYIPSKFFNVSVDLPNIDIEKWNSIKAKNETKKAATEKSNFIRKIINLLMNRAEKVSTTWLHYDVHLQAARASPIEDLLQEYDSMETIENFCNNCINKDILIAKQAKEIKYLRQRLRRSNMNDSFSSTSSSITRQIINVDLRSTGASSELSDLQCSLQDELSKIQAAIIDFGGRIGGRKELTPSMIAFVIGLLTKTKLSNRQCESVLESLPNHLKIFTR
jgi:hypothetical protein